jgi:TolB protein
MPTSRNVVLYSIIFLGLQTFPAGAYFFQSELGLFSEASSVGKTPPGCKAEFNAAAGEYRITGGGNNMWDTGDDFYFVWKKISGDVTLTADIRFLGTSPAEHRKAVLMVRQNLDRGSAYADVAVHGNGLTSLQFRGAENEHTYQIFTQTDQPARVRLVRHGSQFRMYSGRPNEELKPSDPVEYISLKDPVYLGLGVCSHVATAVETAVFSNVSLEGGK